MKRILLAFVLLCFSVNLAFSQAIGNKVWGVDCDVYKYISWLYVSQGKAMPYSTGPWSTDELMAMLNRFDAESLDGRDAELYSKAMDLLTQGTRFHAADGFDFSVWGVLSPEVYVHSNPSDFYAENDWNYDFERRSEVVAMETELLVGDIVYSAFDLGLGYTANIYENNYVTGPNELYQSAFMSNVLFLPNKNGALVSSNFPNYSIIALGGNHWSLSAGRDVLRWGYGNSGNLFLGGNAIYDTNIRFSAFYDGIKYTHDFIFYPHENDVQNATSQVSNLHGIKVFVTQRFDFRLFEDKLNLGIMEGMLYQNYENMFDIRVAFPLMLYHNYFIRNYSNSIMGIEFAWSPVNSLNVYGQWVMDELSFIGEPGAASEIGWRPNKMGFMLGAKYLYPCSLGIFEFNAEGVYAEPYLYLREEYDQATKTQGLSFYGTVRQFSNNPSREGKTLDYIRNCIGYRYGGDCVTGTLSCTWDSLREWLCKAEVFYMAHGIMYRPLNEDWAHGKVPMAPSGQDRTDSPSNPSGSAEHLLRLTLEGEWNFSDRLTASGGMDNWIVWNKDNVAQGPVYDLQMHMGCTFRF